MKLETVWREIVINGNVAMYFPELICRQYVLLMLDEYYNNICWQSSKTDCWMFSKVGEKNPSIKHAFMTVNSVTII